MGPVWQLRIELLDVTSAVWRRFLVPSDIRLPALHCAFQAALGWTNSHLHAFIINGVHYAEPDPEGIEEIEQQDERPVVLTEALGGESRSFDYLYDFGDGWSHVAIVENMFMQSRPGRGVQCRAGEHACPPEDVGGPPGYADFLAAIADPGHPEHENLLAWCGGGFDPARFDLAAVNRELARIRI